MARWYNVREGWRNPGCQNTQLQYYKVELIPGVKIYSQVHIHTIEGRTINRDAKIHNDLLGEISVERFQ